MTIVSFWNNNTGKIGQTYSALAVATNMAVEHNYKILFVSTRYNDQVSMKAFGFDKAAQTAKMLTKNKASMDLESGIEEMSKLALSKRLTPDVVPNYTKVVFNKRLEILSAPKDSADENIDYNRIYGTIKEILSVARKHYDIIFVDLNNGLKDETTKEILAMSNIIVLNIEQKMSEIESLLETKKISDIFPPKKIITLMNDYDRYSKYTTKNVTRYIGEKKEILSVPHNSLYMEAVEEGTLAEFFTNPRIRKLEDTGDKTAFLIHELNRASEAIIYRMQELQMRI